MTQIFEAKNQQILSLFDFLFKFTLYYLYNTYQISILKEIKQLGYIPFMHGPKWTVKRNYCEEVSATLKIILHFFCHFTTSLIFICSLYSSEIKEEELAATFFQFLLSPTYLCLYDMLKELSSIICNFLSKHIRRGTSQPKPKLNLISVVPQQPAETKKNLKIQFI